MEEFIHFIEVFPFVWAFIWNIVIACWIIVVVLFSGLLLKKLHNVLDFITALTVWLILGIVFLGFFPELFTSWANVEVIWASILVWILLFYILELLFHWHHCKDLWHSHSEHKHDHESSNLILTGTFLHNMFHWIELFAAFAIDFRFGIAMSIAILLHSIPQNVANFIMNHKKIKVVLVAAVAWVFWSLLTYPFSEVLTEYKYIVLGVIAWGLLYTSLADIFPSFKSKWNMKNKILYLVWIIVWILLFFWFNEIAHQEHGHEWWNEIHSQEHHDEHE